MSNCNRTKFMSLSATENGLIPLSTVTELVPSSAAVDMQVLNIYKQVNAANPLPRNPLPRNPLVVAIKAQLANLSIQSAVAVLRTFNYGKTQLCLGRNKWVPRDLLNEKYFPNLPGRLASQTPVFWFYGGPPGRLNWYKGTLQTVVDDRILCEINRSGPRATARALGVDMARV